MLISSKHNFLFYHVYKVAGTSIRNQLIPHCDHLQVPMQALTYGLRILGLPSPFAPVFEYHPSLSRVRDYLGDRFYDYYRFCVVREPLDWQKSLYFFAKSNPRHHQHNLIRAMDFNAYLEWRIAHDMKLQSDLIYANDECLVDTIARFETLADDFAAICKRIGVSCELKHLNTAGSGRSVAIAPETLARFRDAFGRDYERLGYPLPASSG